MANAIQNINNMEKELERVQNKLEALTNSLKFEQRTLTAPLQKIADDLDSMLDLEYDALLLKQGDYSTAINDLTFTDQFLDLIISHLMHIQKNKKVKLTSKQDDDINNIIQHLMHIQGSLMIVLNSFSTDNEK